MRYKLSRKAEEDVINIFIDGAGQFGIAQAEHYHQELNQCFRFLAENPLVAPERFEIVPPVRIHPVGSHLVIYQIDENGDIFIIRIRHGREDWRRGRD